MANNKILPGVGKVSRLSLSGSHFRLKKSDVRSQDPVRACEVCGKEKPSSDMINIIVVIGSPGHHSLLPFQHPEEEHWACSIDCWHELSMRVVLEMEDLLRSKHEDGNSSNKV